MKRFKYFFVIIIVIISFASCKEKEYIPEEVDGLHVIVFPPGNEYYEAPKSNNSRTLLPPNVKKMVQVISPNNAIITSWKYDKEKMLSVNSKLENDRYYFTFSPEGSLINLRFKNYEEYKDERPGKIIIKGSKKSISISEVPRKALSVLKKVTLNLKGSESFLVNSAEGKRYVVVINDFAYFIRPDGQIQAEGLVKNGAMKLNDSSNNELLKTHSEVLNDCDSLLKNYKDKFNVKNSIKKVLSSNSGNSRFRFILMGDNRSNKKIWFNIIKHISQLKPKPLFIVNSGDLVPHGYANEYAEYFVPPLMQTDIPFFVAIGNHDCGVRDSTIEYKYLFGDNSLNYYFDLGKFRFIMFDNASRINVNGEALPWLEKTLSETPEDHSIIVFAHKPPKVIDKWAWHAWDKKNSETFVRLMKKYNVRNVFLGHIHGYSTASINGIPYTVSGGGGAELRKVFGEKGNMFHYIICDAMPDGTIEQRVVKFYPRKNN